MVRGPYCMMQNGPREERAKRACIHVNPPFEFLSLSGGRKPRVNDFLN